MAVKCQDLDILVDVVLELADSRLALLLTDGREVVLPVAGFAGLAVGWARRLAGVVVNTAIYSVHKVNRQQATVATDERRRRLASD